MTFPNVLFEMQSKISLSAFILMGTFSYLGAMALEDKNLNISPSNSSYRTPEKSGVEVSYQGYVNSVDSDGSNTPQSPVPVRLGNNTREAIVRVNTSEFCVPKVVSVTSEGLVGALSSPDKRSKMFGQRNLDRIKKLHADVQKNVTAGSGARRKTVSQIHQTEPTSSTDSPLVTYSETYIRSPGNESPGYVPPSLNPYHVSYADEEVLSPSVRRSQPDALTLVSEFSAENSVALNQRLDFGSDISQELMRVRQEKEEFAALLQTYFSGELDSSITQDLDTTEINRNLGYTKSYTDYINADSDLKEEIVEVLMDDPDYKGLNAENAETFLHAKMVDGTPQVQSFFKKIRTIQQKAVKIAQIKHESGQQLAARASDMLVTTGSVVTEIDAKNSLFCNRLMGLLYKEDVLKYMNGKLEVSRDLVDSRNSVALINALEVLTTEFVKASSMNLNLTESQLQLTETIKQGQLTLATTLSAAEKDRCEAAEERKGQNETISRLSKTCEDSSQIIKNLSLQVSSLESANQALILQRESYELEKEALLKRIKELELQALKQPAKKSTFGMKK
ncbi:MAG: hypothetical protein C0432_04210 [Candidatus Puniceispirillum sp.]|nr:hypothetical protein [Candidatus Pelagibacter sp.]MBA4283479.1 hypothetical protein [Candidatus Puniceispirillum sp.]